MRITEDDILREVLASGWVAPDDPLLGEGPPQEAFPVRWGPHIDRLIEAGRLTESQVAAAAARVAAGEAASTIDSRASTSESEGASTLRGVVAFSQRFRIDGLLGRGGMATVYQAFDTVLARHVALKLLPEEDPELVERLLREARRGSSRRGWVHTGGARPRASDDRPWQRWQW